MTTLLLLALLLQDSELDVGGKTRSYILHVGKDAKKPMPLVISLHGLGGDARIQQGLCGFDALADKHGFAVAYPSGLQRMWRFWAPEDDFAFLKAIIDAHAKDGTVDERRVYVCGISNGSLMAHKAALDLADRVAAIGCVAATLPKAMTERSKPPRPMPVIMFHGTEDKLMGYEGGAFGRTREVMLPVEEQARWWAKANGCAETPKVEALDDKESDGTTIERWTFEGDAPVVHYKVTGGGHTWPGGPKVQEGKLGKVTRDINASELMWEFFSKHALPEKTK